MVSVVIPTYNASRYLDAQLRALRSQTVKDLDILIIDSSSSDETLDIAKQYSVQAVTIPKREFDHGGTRTLAGKTRSPGDILVYLTQDALPYDEKAIETLVRPLLTEQKCAAAFGRQIPYQDATPFAQHLRLFNYPPESYIRTYADRTAFGIKAAFCSNSFAAYRRDALEEVGWFTENLVLAEDMHICARMLMKGYKLRYVAEAAVYHSHNYTVAQEFKRYFDLGVFFEKERWLLEEFGRPEGEGIRFVRSELSYLGSRGLLHLLPISLMRAAAKLIGYRLGHYYKQLPGAVLKRVSMHSA
ncbi:MAG: glycosyltransferase family 2 protein [Nitrospira sp.]|nr:MAG: glycosyltransferase family 2 protein [Nitrospira sp.]